ncbi:MAG: hypothetical protein HOC20_04305 [Chloroflexi bacterium]|jgi:hypothetical protein|nr:hypothetical protein [Chloroflexota bacterium]
MAEETLSQAAIDALLSGNSSADPAPPPAPEPQHVQETAPAPEPVPVPVAEEPVPAPEVVAEPVPEPAEPVVATEPVPEPISATKSGPEPVATEEVPTNTSPLSNDALAALTSRIENAEATMSKIAALETEVKTAKLQQSGIDPEYKTRLESLENSVLTICHIQQEYTRDPELDKIPRLQKELAKANELIETLSSQLQSVQNKLQQAAKEIALTKDGLNGTWGHDIQRNFECQSCGERGYVLGLVKCSECGDEDWWGWWPPEHDDSNESDVAFSREDNYH